ncbi:MAG TPA: arginine decarboxylase, partial [Spirochaetota bacterium]|nr:arginine decarboxylase [Spirochaetota bacterium]
MIKPELLDRWKIKNSEDLYGIKTWGASYFEINDKGEVSVTPFADKPDVSVSLVDIIKGIKERGLDAPVLLRFENLLDSQLTFLNESFNAAI